MDKDIEHISRGGDDGSVDFITIGTIASLDITEHLNDDALFEVSSPTGYDSDRRKYISKSVKWRTISSKLQESSFGHFDSEYSRKRHSTLKDYLVDNLGTTDSGASQAVTEANSTVYNFLKNAEYSAGMETDLAGAPLVWGDVFSLAVRALEHTSILDEHDRRLLDLEHTSLAYGGDSAFVTSLSVFQTLSGDSVGKRSGVYPRSLAAAYDDPSSGLEEGFVVALYEKSQVSSVYECEKTGILCLYGWVDTTNIGDRVYLPDAWCALEGYVGSNWEILSLCPVTPNKQLCYAGFTVPVIEGLNIRVRTGFIPGDASKRYPHGDVSGSLSNRTANAFVGGIYYSGYSRAAEISTRDMAGASVPHVIQNVYSTVQQTADLSGYVTKDELGDAIPKDFYPKSRTFTKKQVRKGFGYMVQKADVLPEVSLKSSRGVRHGNDGRPVNRLAVWNFAVRGEQPVGTVIEHVRVPEPSDGVVFLPGREEWAYCNGAELPASEYEELASAMGVSDKIVLPDTRDADGKTGLAHYVKVRSSYHGCERTGWSEEILRSAGMDSDAGTRGWKDDPELK